MEIKILYIITGLGVGGAETMLYKLVRSLDRSNYTPTVISLSTVGEVGKEIASLGVPIHSLNMTRGSLSFAAVFRLIAILRAVKPDIVHTWMYHADLLGGVVARCVGYSNIVWSIRNNSLDPKMCRAPTRLAAKLCSMLSDIIPLKIISCSKKALNVHADLGYSRNKMLVIPNGFDLSQFIPSKSSRQDVRQELGLSSSSQLVGLVARFDPQKNHLGFLSAAKMIHNRLPHVHFLLCGDGVDNNNLALRGAIEGNKSFASRIHLLGRRSDISRIMAALDVLALSSFSEAFPNVVGEAMACGIPCVVTDVGDCAEIVGGMGAVVRNGDMSAFAEKTIGLLELPHEERAMIGQQARERVAQEFDIRNIALLYQSLYSNITHNRTRANTTCVE